MQASAVSNIKGHFSHNSYHNHTQLHHRLNTPPVSYLRRPRNIYIHYVLVNIKAINHKRQYYP